MNKKTLYIIGLVIIFLAAGNYLLYRYKPDLFASVLTTYGNFEFATNQNNVNVYWKYPGITTYRYAGSLPVARQYKLIQCKRGVTYNIKLVKTGFRDNFFNAFCPKRTGIILLTPK
ncbi:MAG TPA: hypothetical protein VJJ80_03595 [Patescibacteria group bacterium]|nr:hypothetical protein [Patescibacteria group bacterium]